MSALSPVRVLNQYSRIDQPTAPLEFLGNAGGRSGSQLWRFPASRGRLLLRAWPTTGPDLAAIQAIHRDLKRAEPLGFVPTPLETVDGRTIVNEQDRLWELTPWLSGQPDLNRPPDERHVHEALVGLAALHRRLEIGTVVLRTAPGVEIRATELERLDARFLEDLRRTIQGQGEPSCRELAMRWLERVRPRLPGLRQQIPETRKRAIRCQRCVRDVRPDHFLFEGWRLRGLVDFGASGTDSVAVDLARLIGEWLGADLRLRARAVQSYESIRPLDRNERTLIPWIEEANAVLGPWRWVQWHFLEGRRFDEPDAVENGLKRGLERLDERDACSGLILF